MASEHHGQVKYGGLPLPGATVTATQGDKKQVAITDVQGAYSFADLPDGVWNIQVEMLCFAPETKEVAVASDAPSPVWELKLLPLEQMKPAVAPAPTAAPASSAAPNGAAPPPTTAAAATPSTAAAAPAAGAASNKNKSKRSSKSAPPPTNTAGGFQRADVNASNGSNGSNGNAAGGSMVGGDASSSPAPSEFAQQASDSLVVNGSVSNGIERRAIGNARKGPGSMYRGDIFGILNNSVLDAQKFSVTGQQTQKTYYNNLRMGVTFGGPLYIPHVTHWAPNSGNFFLTYQLGRNKNSNVQPGLMPTVAQRAGDFSQTLTLQGQPVTIYDPSTEAPFPGNRIPASRIDPAARVLLSLYPLPNFVPTANYNYQVALPPINNTQAIQARVNRTINTHNFINSSFAWQGTNAKNPTLFGFNDTNTSAGLNGSLAWRHIFTREFSLNLSDSFSRSIAHTNPFFTGRENIAGQAGITGDNQQPQNWGPPSLSFSSGISGLSDTNYSVTRNQTNAIGISGLWIKRPHNITFGGDYRSLEFNPFYQQDPRGSFGFTGVYTQPAGAATGTPGLGYDFADFLLGVPDTSSIAFGNADKYFRTTWWDGYITDDWRIAAGLSVNWGMRWEYGSPAVEKYGRLVNLDVAPGFVAEQPVLGANPAGPLTGLKYPAALLRPDHAGFQPRIGIAWHPFFGSSTIVRAGYSITDNTSVYQAITQQMAQQSPFSKSFSVQNSLADPLTLTNGFNASPTSTLNTFGVDPNFRIGYAQNWQVSVQQDVMEGIVATATYLGIKGTRQVQEFLPNTYPIGAANPCLACLPGYTYETSNGNSTRNAGSLALRRRFHAGFTASLLYTYSKSLDDASLGGRGQGSAVIAQNWLDLSAERGLSNFDQRHLVNVQAQYSPGTGLHGGGLMSGWHGVVLKGWTFVTNLNLGTGLPLTPLWGYTVPGTGVTGPIRPEFTGASIYNAPPGRSLNPEAFTAPPAGLWGDAGRGTITGPSQFSLNASMARNFKNSLDLRFDATNVLNHVTFPSWNTTISSAQFGQAGTANGMRQMLVTLRYRF